MAEQELKDHDSVFRELQGTAVHYKLAQGLNPAHPTAVHCYHGFGANTFSWSYVYKALSEQLHAQVTKHDMPGFGLTQRPRDIDGYSLEFNGRLGRLVMDAELAAAGVLNTSELDPCVGPGVRLEELQSVSKEHRSGQGEAEWAATTSNIETAAAVKTAEQSKVDPGTVSCTNTQSRNNPDTNIEAESRFKLVAGSRKEPDLSHGSAESLVPDSPISSRTSWDSVSSVDSNRDLGRGQAAASSADSGCRGQQQQNIKRVLIGHSLGAACAAAEVIHHSKVWQQFFYLHVQVSYRQMSGQLSVSRLMLARKSNKHE